MTETAPETAKRGSYDRGRKRRAEIIETALSVFAAKGYGATSMREISAQAGLSQAGLLHHFSSKDELLLEVIKLRDKSIDDHLKAIGANTIRERVLAIVEYNHKERKLSTVYTMLLAEAITEDSTVASYYHRRYEEQQRVTTLQVAEEQARGLIREGNPAHIASLIVAMMDGFLIQQELVRDISPHEYVTSFFTE